MNRFTLISIALCLVSFSGNASTIIQTKDSVQTSIGKTEKQKSTFWQKAMKPIKWIGKNWSAYDPQYSTPSFYIWVVQLQNTTSMEWVRIWNPDGMDITTHAKMSNKIGPHLGYKFLMFGATIDLNAIKGTNNRNEFTLSVNSNLFNIDLIRRRTGGDFSISRLKGGYIDPLSKEFREYDFHDVAHSDNDLGDMVRVSTTGLNINYFTNHRKYSNPAAFSNGAIQLRSVGSPIIGFGYVHQKLTNDFGNAIVDYAFNESASKMSGQYQAAFLDEINQNRQQKFGKLADYYDYMADIYKNDRDKYKNELKTFIGCPSVQPLIFGDKDTQANGDTKMKNSGMLGYFYNGIPTEIVSDDWHLQLGYAYNLVFSRRLLLGISAIVSPSLKRVKYNNAGCYVSMISDDFAKTANSYYGKGELFHSDDFKIDNKYTGFGLNGAVRLSLTYNYNRWRAGFNIKANSYNFMGKDFTVANNYGSAVVYVGYCFGRKKMYRDGGRAYQAYVSTALSKQQIAEQRDSMPESNLGKGNTFIQKGKKTKYHNDRLRLDIYGCDLAKGPDGNYGTFTIEDGLITPGEDTENHLKPGNVLSMDSKGNIHISAGHRSSYLPANWLKRRISERQIPYNQYTEMLHYVIKGKLVFYVRNHAFGTNKPVKVEFDNFYITHGYEGMNYMEIMGDGFESHSSFSIIGNKKINGRLCRIYIESKDYSTRFDVYINMLRKSGRTWMSRLSDDRSVSSVSLPATHDAGTASLPESIINSTAHTQNFTITEQLQDGVRGFDIRLKKNMKFGHTIECRDGFDDTMKDIKEFLAKNPSEFIIAMIGSDEGGKWSDEMKKNFSNLIAQYRDLFVENFDATTKVGDVRGKVLVIRRQEVCPFGKLLKFSDNTTFQYDCFDVEDVYREHKTYKKCKIVASHLQRAYENTDPAKWFITFNSIAWDPRHHKPYYTAWGSAVNIRKPMNPTLRELIENKLYNNMGMIFLDFYNDHGDKPWLVESIIDSNFRVSNADDYITEE